MHCDGGHGKAKKKKFKTYNHHLEYGVLCLIQAMLGLFFFSSVLLFYKDHGINGLGSLLNISLFVSLFR